MYIIYMHTMYMEYYSAFKKKEILPFLKAWIDLEVIRKSEVNQRKKILNDTTYKWHLEKGNQMQKQRM